MTLTPDLGVKYCTSAVDVYLKCIKDGKSVKTCKVAVLENARHMLLLQEEGVANH